MKNNEISKRLKKYEDKISDEEKIGEELFIKNTRARGAMFHILWMNMVEPYIEKSKYEFCHGNDVLLKNISDEDDRIISKFLFYSVAYLKYLGKYHFRKFDENIDRKHLEKYEEILYKHLFDY
ncbi:MAG: hypothetical protein KGV57_03515 [Fusobacterium sp.]|nr:hypothetical protein [Fusobacterium sp.]